ncbi:MAG TPA: hypothetical protein VIT44_12440 [Cyclobacteriaceae bacterium]
MERRSNIQQHPHQESRKGYPLYASRTRMKSTTNESKEFQIFERHRGYGKNPTSVKRYFLPFRDDEDSDERTLYFGNKNQTKESNKLRQ